MSKPQASLNLLTNHNLWIFGNPFSVSQSQAPFHCCFTSSVLWRGSLQKFCFRPWDANPQGSLVKTHWFPSKLVCKPYEHQPPKQQKFWDDVGTTAAIWWNGHMSAEAEAQPAQQERTRKKKINKICVWAMIRDLWTWKDVIWDRFRCFKESIWLFYTEENRPLFLRTKSGSHFFSAASR